MYIHMNIKTRHREYELRIRHVQHIALHVYPPALGATAIKIIAAAL